MKHRAKALGLLAAMMPLALALPLTLALAAAATAPTVDGVWGISEQGTGGQGASCDRWAARGPGS